MANRRSVANRMKRFTRQVKSGLLSGTVGISMDTDSRTGVSDLRFDRRLDRIVTRSEDLSRVYFRFGEHMMRSVDRTHKEQGRPRKWAPLAPSTQRERARLGYGAKRPILERTGEMRRSYRFFASARVFEMFNEKFFWIYHQLGGPDLPQRQMLLIQREDERMLNVLLDQHLKDV